MKWLALIEDKINQLILKIFSKIADHFFKLIPHPIKLFFTGLKNSYRGFIAFLKILPFILLNKVLNLLNVLKNFPLKEFLIKTKTSWKESQGRSKSLPKAIVGFITNNYNNITNDWSLIEKIMIGSSSMMTLVLSWQIYHRINIVDSNIDRSIASLSHEDKTQTNPRPDYYKLEKRELTYHHFYIPLYFPKVNEVRSINIDFSVTLSNRYTKLYLSKNDFALRDFIIMNFEPVDANFALTPEGKEVIKNKILEESNHFLKTRNIDGKVDDVKIIYLLSH